MIIVLRVLIVIVVTYLTMVGFSESYFGMENNLGNYAISLLLLAGSYSVYSYISMYCYVYRATKGESFCLRGIESGLAPFSLVYLFGFPLIGIGVLAPDYLIIMFGLGLVLYGQEKKIQSFFWRRRLKDFVDLPSDGRVSEKEMSRLGIRAFGLLVLLPVIGRLLSYFYN